MAYYMLSAIPKPSTPAPLAIAQPSACFAIVPPHRRYKLFLVGSLSTAQPSACFAIVPPHRPFKLFLLGFETATWHVLARHNPPLALPSYLPIGPSNCFYWASKLLHGTFWPGLLLQQLSKASAPHNPPLALPSYLPIGPSNCFYWASKLLHGTFWPGLNCFRHGTFWPGLLARP